MGRCVGKFGVCERPNMPDKGSHSQRRNGRERRRRRRHLTDHLLVFGEGAPGSYQTHPPGQPRLLYAYPPGVPLPPSIATFCFPGGALPPAAQGSPIFSCNVVSSATRRVHTYVEKKAGVNRSALAEAGGRPVLIWRAHWPNPLAVSHRCTSAAWPSASRLPQAVAVTPSSASASYLRVTRSSGSAPTSTGCTGST